MYPDRKYLNPSLLALGVASVGVWGIGFLSVLHAPGNHPLLFGVAAIGVGASIRATVAGFRELNGEEVL